jgi:sporulation inhibitor KapD
MIELDNKIIGIKKYKKIEFFYFQNSQMNVFKRYLYVGNWIDLEYDEEKTTRRGPYLAYVISFVNRLEAEGLYDHIVYYDKKDITSSLYDFLGSLDNTMFLDLEMTMPPYNFKGKGFRTEVIQAGFIIFDKNGEELMRYRNFIEPMITKTLSKRAEKFLGITNEEFIENQIPYLTFYNDFKEIIEKYNPAIVVYGKNDILVLNDSYLLHNVPSLKDKTRYVNLCQLIKSHYELRNDPGLFKLFQIYYDNEDIQVHDAFNDSEVTAKVFEAFREDILYKTKTQEIKDNFD